MPGKILIANWKMNPAKESEAVKLAKAVDEKNVVICPPFPFISAVAKVLENAEIGAQDVFWEETGAFTGEVSLDELQSLNVSHVIVGHSERRSLGETDEAVAKKLNASFAKKITPILCIGETRIERDEQKTKEVIDRQLRSAFSLIPAGGGDSKPLVYIAYEPVWAISSNQTGEPLSASPDDVVAVISYMQGIIRGVPITPIFLYGGSVNAKILVNFLDRPEIAGALVGAASLKSVDFKQMIKTAGNY